MMNKDVSNKLPESVQSKLGTQVVLGKPISERDKCDRRDGRALQAARSRGCSWFPVAVVTETDPDDQQEQHPENCRSRVDVIKGVCTTHGKAVHDWSGFSWLQRCHDGYQQVQLHGPPLGTT